MKKNSTSITTTIAEVAPGGDGVAVETIAGERRAIFVHAAAIGDRVKLTVDLSRRPARGVVDELIARGEGRVDPACAYVARCGGCNFMHLDAKAQRAAHEHFVRGALPDAWKSAPITVHEAPSALGYRTRARLHVRASGGRAIVGMHELRSHDPVEVDVCVVLDPRVEEARKALGPLLEGAQGRGEAQIALGKAAPVLDLKWSQDLPAACFARLERGVKDGAWGGARVFCGDTTKPATIGDPTPTMPGADGAPLRLGLGGFAQSSDAGNRLLASRVASLAASVVTPQDRVVELYAGAGNLTVMLAPLARDLVAVESGRDACEAARENLHVRGLKARINEGDAEAYTWNRATKLLVLDPPRAGARAVMERLVASPVKHVLYVSCDPQTLGRDLTTLAGVGYAPLAIETFEMFPQTSHVESVVLVRRGN